MTEDSASMVIDVYWDGEAPKEIIKREKSPRKKDILKDW